MVRLKFVEFVFAFKQIMPIDIMPIDNYKAIKQSEQSTVNIQMIHSAIKDIDYFIGNVGKHDEYFEVKIDC